MTRAPDTSHPHCSLSSGHTCPACRRGQLGRGHSLVLLLSGLGIDCTGCARLLQSVFTTGSPQLLAAPARVTRASHGACAGPGPASSIGPYRQISVAIICTWDREAAALIMLRGGGLWRAVEGCQGRVPSHRITSRPTLRIHNTQYLKSKYLLYLTGDVNKTNSLN